MSRLHELRIMNHLDPHDFQATPLVLLLGKVVERIAEIQSLERKKKEHPFGATGNFGLDRMVDSATEKNSRRTRALRPPPRWGINE